MADEPQPAPQPPQEPLLVRVIEDDELSTFERRTGRYAMAGVGVAFLALVAACVTAYFIAGQFGEMAKQTSILAQSLEKQKQDSVAAAITTDHQLSILSQQLSALQEQSTQQGVTLEMDQRPWLKFELDGLVPPGSDPNSQARTIPSFIAGQPVKIPIRVTNIGKTAAEQSQGILFVQLVSKGTEPILPETRLIFNFFSKQTHSEGKVTRGVSIAAQGWYGSTLYPGQVQIASYSRMTYGPNREIIESPATIDEINGFNGGTVYLFIVGQVWYPDVFGVKHWTKFCVSTDPVGDVANLKCARFGAVDNNHSEPKEKTKPN
jgi:hypothetical protein